jgi:hypothetical protein
MVPFTNANNIVAADYIVVRHDAPPTSIEIAQRPDIDAVGSDR